MGRIWLIPFLAPVLLLSCGDPRGGDPRARFTFTPIAVYTFVATPTSLEEAPISFSEKCAPFIADEVLVIAETTDFESLDHWFDEVGFTVRRSFESGLGLNLTVDVPPGSVPDAVRLIGKQPGVRSAEPNGLAEIPEESSLAETLGCTPVAGGIP